nr:HAMP domain-containing sensor histidine kinase [uncultured Flavobacterium sp.]
MIRKYFTFPSFVMLKFEHRKAIHYVLLICVLFIQILVVVIWYNETKNESKLSKSFSDISSANKIAYYTNKVNSSFIDSQEYFNLYINYKDEVSLKKYASSLYEMRQFIDSLKVVSNNNETFKNILTKKNSVQSNIFTLESVIDSIINKQIQPNDNDFVKNFKFRKFEFKKILDSIKVKSDMKIDSVSKKGLFSRLGNAIAGKSEVQKERLNVTITMKYKDKVTSGSIEDQIAGIFLMTNKYYEKEFSNLKKNFIDLRNEDLKLLKLNDKIFKLSQNLLPKYSSDANMLQKSSQKNFQDQFRINKSVRSYVIIALIILMFIISIILFSFTHIAFEYEKKLTNAQNLIRQSLNFKNRIMGMISHEIRSPLSIISIYSEKVSASVKDVGIKETFKSIQFTTNSLLLLANQILEYSKDEKKALQLKCKNFNLNTEIIQIVSSMASLLETKGNKIELNTNLNSDCEVYSDAAKIHQLFYNIIGNANKFTKNGLVSIIVDIEKISDYELNLKVEIKDDGAGISEDDLKNVFESYFQGTVSEKVNDLGVGLGLNLCKEIVELFNGEIKIESKEGIETKVSFNLILNEI